MTVARVSSVLTAFLGSAGESGDIASVLVDFEDGTKLKLDIPFQSEAEELFKLARLYLPEKKVILATDPIKGDFANKRRLITSRGIEGVVNIQAQLAEYICAVRNLPPQLALPNKENRFEYVAQRVIPWYDLLLNSLEKGNCVTVPIEEIIGKRVSLLSV
ncbi:MAG: hypothetical protein Q7K43_01950 [Candidatus Woesearchaeota archaeon]|nr:hypothetical protein [Candidatus Woesearchaeota archaeon]